ncbi:hypothetical protein X975_19070, partial [Stegodyphus mimosarum]
MQLGSRFSLMDDKACPHESQLLDGYSKSEDIHRRNCPARSSDLNPIQHIWAALEKAILSSHHASRTNPKL